MCNRLVPLFCHPNTISVFVQTWPPHFRTFCELVEGEENKLTTFSTWTIMLGCFFQQHLCKLGQFTSIRSSNEEETNWPVATLYGLRKKFMAATVYTSQEPIFFPRSHDTHMSLAGPGVGLFLPLRVVVMVVRDLSGTRRFVHLQTLALSRPRLPTMPCGTVCIIYTYMMCVVCIGIAYIF